jgi:menaquinone-specific isochorismate synthase
VPSVRTRGKLPHWEEDHAIYFVTFRLADSLPKSILRAFEFERKNIVATAKQMGRRLSLQEEKRLEELFSDQIQTKLDAGIGRCFLAKPSVGKLVAEVLQHFNLCRYRIYAWCVMPNHVHVLFRIFEGHALAGIVHAWKSYSSNRANRILRRSGRFWQREYYDHIVRSEDEFYRVVSYIAENPKKAGLRDWRWVDVDLRK